MNQETWNHLDREFSEFPIMKAEGVSSEEVDAASHELQHTLPQDYRDFLLRYGGAIVGPYPIYGLRKAEAMAPNRWSVVEVTKEFQKARWQGIEEWVVISMDHAGNPIGIAPDGRIWRSDHDVGDVMPISDSFESFINDCLKLSDLTSGS